MAVKIDIETPKECNKCPCAWFDPEAYYDPMCGVTSKVLRENFAYPSDSRAAQIQRPEWCPLSEIVMCGHITDAISGARHELYQATKPTD